MIVWDVSALVDLQIRIEQQRTMGRWVRSSPLAHEFRNPLFASRRPLMQWSRPAMDR